MMMRRFVFAVLAIVALIACLSIVDAKSNHHRIPSSSPIHRRPFTINPRPIVGVVSLANSDNDNEEGSFISADYVKWLEQSGARVAVVPFNLPKLELDTLIDGLNGLLFTGGDLSLNTTTVYFQQALYMFNKARSINDAGDDVFPIWGTCQGFQLLHLMVTNPVVHSSVLKCRAYDSENLVLALNFTSAAPQSRLFRASTMIPAVWDEHIDTSPSIYDVYATQNITMNLHNCGIHPDDYTTFPILADFFTVLSTNVDRVGLPFVSTVEGIHYPFYASQWHPERTQFEWDADETLNHSQQSISAHQYMSQRFMIDVRKSAHRFPNAISEAASLIYNYLPTFTGGAPLKSLPVQQKYFLQYPPAPAPTPKQ